MEIMTIKALERFIEGAVIPEDLFIRMQKAYMNGEKSIIVPDGTKEELNRKLNAIKEKRKTLAKIAELNNKGIAYEKEGKIKKAIKAYEQNIESDYPAHHSFKRLAILYRKSEDYTSEIRVIKRALEVLKGDEYYKERLIKATNLIEKRSKLK